MFKRIFLLTTVAVLLVAFAVAPAIALLPNGQQAPNFTLADLSGTTHSLTDYRGKVVVIDFFGADCSACKSSAKNDLVPLYNNYYRGDGRVQFLGVEVTGASAAYTSSNFVNPTGITWPVLVGGTPNLLSSYGSSSTPTVYVLDSAGNVALATTSIDSSTLKSTIDKLASSVSSTGPAACARDANSLDVFVQGTDHALWHDHYQVNSGWSGWESLGGVLTSSPAAATQGSNRIDVFVRGTTGALWQKTTTDGGKTWSNWYSLGGILPAGTGPAASWGADRLDVFVQGTTGALYHKSATTTWSGWENLGGILTSSPAAATQGSNRIDVFVRGTTGVLWQKTTTDGGTTWSNWYSLGGILPAGTGPAASWGADRLDVFVQGTTGALYHKSATTTWSGWENLGGILTSSPAAATATGTNRIDVFVRGTDSALWQKSYDSSSDDGWGAWSKIGGLLA